MKPPSGNLLTALVLLLPAVAAAQTPKRTLADFKRLTFIVGQWKGTGGGSVGFFESYQLVNDSTIVMRNHRDATYGAAADSTRIQLRGGVITHGLNEAAEVTDSSVTFRAKGATVGGFTFTTRGKDRWVATLYPAAANLGGGNTVYVMQRAPAKK